MYFPIHPSSRQCTYTIPPEFWWSTDILLIINPSTGMDQEIHPCGQGRIDSVKINPSLLRMRECMIFALVVSIGQVSHHACVGGSQVLLAEVISVPGTHLIAF